MFIKIDRDPKDFNIMSNLDERSNYDLASQFPNPHVHQNSKSHPPDFHLNSSGLHPSHLDLQYGATPTFQSLLNAPMVINQSGVSNAHFPIYTPMTNFQTPGNNSLGSNRIPVSTPMVPSQIGGNTTGMNNQNEVTPKGLKKRVKDVQTSSGKKDWGVEEEIALTNAWLNVSLDPIVAVNNFAGHYSKLERHPQSGTNSKDLIHKALGMYEDIEGTKFKWVHCWEIIIKNPKWQSKHDKNNAPDRQADDENKSPTSEESLLNIIDDNITPEGDGVGRPTGRKNSKEKKRKLHDKRGVVDALNKLQSTLAKQAYTCSLHFGNEDERTKEKTTRTGNEPRFKQAYTCS
ncbi:NAM-like protein-like [Striga asiatica]|uniref:NAM-like protein-like n=1 Tax=Striga asiatica TaxID=4170 RepID=A0A5A7QWZ3_STRAF|nr:NAM-like protein-like [Striga asiatica]